MRLLSLVSISALLLVAAAAAGQPPSDAPTATLSSTVTDPAAGAPADVGPASRVAMLKERVATLKETVRRQVQIISKLQHSLRVSVATTGGLALGFLCIHSFEASWTNAGPRYWGGLQFDAAFMSTYGGSFLRAWGTADHWPPFVQIAVAENAYLSGRGFHPWPTTARLCGLL